MRKIELVQKYTRVNEIGKAIDVVLKYLPQMTSEDEQIEILTYILDEILIPHNNESVINELKQLVVNNTNLLLIIDTAKKSKNTNKAHFELNYTLLEELNKIFSQLDFELNGSTDGLTIEKKLSNLKLESIKSINKEFYQLNIENRQQIEKEIDECCLKIEKLAFKHQNDSNIFFYFYDELIFDIELIYKRSLLVNMTAFTTYLLNVYKKGNFPYALNNLESKI